MLCRLNKLVRIIFRLVLMSRISYSSAVEIRFCSLSINWYLNTKHFSTFILSNYTISCFFTSINRRNFDMAKSHYNYNSRMKCFTRETPKFFKGILNLSRNILAIFLAVNVASLKYLFLWFLFKIISGANNVEFQNQWGKLKNYW